MTLHCILLIFTLFIFLRMFANLLFLDCDILSTDGISFLYFYQECVWMQRIFASLAVAMGKPEVDDFNTIMCVARFLFTLVCELIRFR